MPPGVGYGGFFTPLPSVQKLSPRPMNFGIGAGPGFEEVPQLQFQTRPAAGGQLQQYRGGGPQFEAVPGRVFDAQSPQGRYASAPALELPNETVAAPEASAGGGGFTGKLAALAQQNPEMIQGLLGEGQAAPAPQLSVQNYVPPEATFQMPEIPMPQFPFLTGR